MIESFDLLNTGIKSTINIDLPASKSISNRLLVLDFLYESNIELKNLSEANDTKFLISAINSIKNKEENIYVADCGTAMRFLISVLAITPGQWYIYGTEEMHKRSVRPLVEALIHLGADICYSNEEGYPPLKITGNQIKGGEVHIDGSISSQFVSSLMMIAGILPQGINIYIENKSVSLPYIYMTSKLMSCYIQSNNKLQILNFDLKKIAHEKLNKIQRYKVEADWSSASYWYALVACGIGEVNLLNLSLNSIQGDSICAEIFKSFGVVTEELNDGLRIYKNMDAKLNVEFDFSQCPDLVQTVAVTCAILRVRAKLNGIGNLVHKETNRIISLSTELNKMYPNSIKAVGNDSIFIDTTRMLNPMHKISIETYKDHRMAMAFSVFSVIFPIKINEPNVVKKSYPDWWEHISTAGIQITQNY